MERHSGEVERKFSNQQILRVAAALYTAERLNTDPPFEEAPDPIQDHYAKLANIAIASLRK
jgi:hypothetical protein